MCRPALHLCIRAAPHTRKKLLAQKISVLISRQSDGHTVMWQVCLCQFNSKENRKFWGVIYFISKRENKTFFYLSVVCKPTPRGGVLLGILGGAVPSGSPNPDPYFRPKNVIFHTCFQTRPLKSIPVFRPGLQAEIMLSLLRLER